MAEVKQETEKKKRGLFRRIGLILKWISLILLGILLIAALAFNAPLKVTTLLAIILLACTILPGPYRKWFWASVCVVVIVLVVWVFLPDDNEGWRPYTFDEELAALEAEHAIPDEENAAVIYNQLFETPILDGNEPEFFCQATPDSTSGPWLTKDHPETKKWLDGHQSTIATLLEASNKEKCHFPIISDTMSLGLSMERLAALRTVTYLLISAANNDMAEGRIDPALEKYFCVIQMAQHQYQQPSTTDFMLGYAIEEKAGVWLNQFVIEAQPTEIQLHVISDSFKKLKDNWSSKLPEILECDKLITKSLLNSFYEINLKGNVRLSRDPTAAFRAQFPQEMPVHTYWQRKLIKAYTMWSWFCIPTSPQRAAKIIDASYGKLYKMADPNYAWPTKSPPVLFPRRFCTMKFFDMLTPSEPIYHTLHDVYLQIMTERYGSRILIALRRYKNKNSNWPKSLNDIKALDDPEIFIDLINGDSFVYKLTCDGFVLYSKGKNGIDEEGVYNAPFDPNELKWPEVEQDDILIWPPREHEPKEENASDK